LIGDAEHFREKRYYDFSIRDYWQFVEKASLHSPKPDEAWVM
jgi:hypothetical protein